MLLTILTCRQNQLGVCPYCIVFMCRGERKPLVSVVTQTLFLNIFCFVSEAFLSSENTCLWKGSCSSNKLSKVSIHKTRLNCRYTIAILGVCNCLNATQFLSMTRWWLLKNVFSTSVHLITYTKMTIVYSKSCRVDSTWYTMVF